MRVVRHAAELRTEGTTGLVPTMGGFHEGHLSLFRAARTENDTVVASLFVNPAQFAPGEDLDRYPRDEERDAALAEDNGIDVLFAPAAEEIYPERFQTWVDVEKLGSILEGEHRPGHFRLPDRPRRRRARALVAQRVPLARGAREGPRPASRACRQ